MPCADPTAGGDSTASARMTRKRASLGGRSDDEKTADPAWDRLGACCSGGRPAAYFFKPETHQKPGSPARARVGQVSDARRGWSPRPKGPLRAGVARTRD